MYKLTSKALVLLILILICSACKETILHNLSEPDANRVISELHQKALSSEKIRQADGLWSVAVEKENSLEALSILSSARIIKEQPKLKNNSTSIMSSREEQLFQFERALSQEIEYTLASLPGVLETRVHLNLPVRDPLFAQQISDNGASSASVMLIVNDEFKAKNEEIQKLVGGASGIKQEQISVLSNKIDKLNSSKQKSALLQLESSNTLVNNYAKSSTSIFKNLYGQIVFSLIIMSVGYLLYLLRRKNRKISDLKELYSNK